MVVTNENESSSSPSARPAPGYVLDLHEQCVRMTRMPIRFHLLIHHHDSQHYHPLRHRLGLRVRLQASMRVIEETNEPQLDTAPLITTSGVVETEGLNRSVRAAKLDQLDSIARGAYPRIAAEFELREHGRTVSAWA